jgi:hypothetical protein
MSPVSLRVVSDRSAGEEIAMEVVQINQDDGVVHGWRESWTATLCLLQCASVESHGRRLLPRWHRTNDTITCPDCAALIFRWMRTGSTITIIGR